MPRSFLSTVQRAAWRTSSIAGDARAVQRTAEGHPGALAKRAIHKRAYRAGGRATRSILRSFGL